MGRLDAARDRSERAEDGFTLLELLVVLVILALLAAIATPQVMKYLARARVDAARIQVDALGSAVELFYLDNGRYPTAEEGLTALIKAPPSAPNWNGPYVKRNASLVDPWGAPYQYHPPGKQGDFEIATLGADKAVGGTGEAQDISSSR